MLTEKGRIPCNTWQHLGMILRLEQTLKYSATCKQVLVLNSKLLLVYLVRTWSQNINMILTAEFAVLLVTNGDNIQLVLLLMFDIKNKIDQHKFNIYLKYHNFYDL